jgi:hypothetical protein
MKQSKPPDPATETDFPIAEHAGFEGPIPDHRDPYEILDDMMAVVEALCPEYPEREVFRAEGDWRL